MITHVIDLAAEASAARARRDERTAAQLVEYRARRVVTAAGWSAAPGAAAAAFDEMYPAAPADQRAEVLARVATLQEAGPGQRVVLPAPVEPTNRHPPP